MKTLAGILAGAFVVSTAACGVAAKDQATTGKPLGARLSADPDEYAKRLLRKTNAAREEQGLAPLERSVCADRQARRRAADLRGQQLEHRPLAAVVDACAPGSRAAENLAATARPAAAVVAAWMDSPGHRNNIVDPALHHVGVGCARDEDRLICVQLLLGEL